MYYLRKQSTEKLAVTDGKYTVKDAEYELDRALYKHKKYNRFYRSTYPDYSTDLKLWKVKSLKTALQQRVRLWYYCNEWFDIYDDETNEPIPTDLYEKYEASPFSKIWTTKTLYLNNNTGKITDVKNFTEPHLYKTIRKGSKLNVYRAVDYYKMWQLDNIFEDQVICVNTVGDVIFKFADDADFMNCTDNDLFETYWDRKWKKEGKV